MLTPEQLALRKTGIGGSDAAAICGLSKYATPLDVYLSKTTDVIKEETDAMRRGTLLEPFVKALFEHKTGWSVETISHTIRSKEYPFMLANIDGYIPCERAIAEFKTAHYKTKSEWGEEGTDEMPKEYLIQNSHYTPVLEVNKAYVGVLFGDENLFKALIALQKIKEAVISYPINFDELDLDFRIYTYTKTPILEDRLVKREKSFWFDHVQKEIMPPLQEGRLKDVLKVYPRAIDKVIYASSSDKSKLQELFGVKQSIKELEKREESLKTDILTIFKDASFLVDSDGTKLATWKNKKPKETFDKERFSKDYPGLLNQFTTTSDQIERTLRIL